MAGIYVHIPFCKKACHYCDFHFSTSLIKKSEMTNAICQEIILRKSEIKEENIETIYFGGGTPSLLTQLEAKQILETIYNNFDVCPNPEITIEANPDDLNLDNLKSFKEVGFNRLSIGIQCFQDHILQWMNRAHNAKEAIESVKWAKNCGFNNITVDLIYGIPQMTLKDWESNIQRVIDLDIQHISAYNLTIEENTALYHQVQKGKSKDISDSQGEEHLKILIKMLSKVGFEQYEVSNFAKKGFHSHHNSSYWKSKIYIGIGPSAHSFNGSIRSWNISNNARYIRAIEDNNPLRDEEVLSPHDQINEHIMIGLRNIWGCEWGYIKDRMQKSSFEEFQKQIFKLEEEGLINSDENSFFTTKRGLLFADQIASNLFLID